jgi:hypothetical protein
MNIPTTPQSSVQFLLPTDNLATASIVLMTEDRRWEIVNSLHAVKHQRCLMQHSIAFDPDSMTFDASAVREIHKPGRAILQLKGMERIYNVCAVSLFTPQNCLRLLSFKPITAFHYFAPFVLWYQVILDTELAIEYRIRIMGLVLRVFVLWLEAIPALSEFHGTNQGDNRT